MMKCGALARPVSPSERCWVSAHRDPVQYVGTYFTEYLFQCRHGQSML